MSRFTIQIDGTDFEVEQGVSLAAALINAGIWKFRTDLSETGFRAPICAMGVCFECRVTVDGQTHRRACMETCRPGMQVVTGD